ncbi:MAG: pilin protein [Selenomonadaceae bacterium]
MLKRISAFRMICSGQRGQGIVEYALLLAFVVAVAVAVTSGTTGLEAAITGVFSRVATALGGA